MTITLFVEPGSVYDWDGFKIKKPECSIALDGFVNASTKRDPKGPYANFDHHSHCDRIATRSTSDQVHMDINLGLFDSFKRYGLPHANVFVNDPDEDTCLAWWLLKNHELVINHAQPKINRLVYCEDRLDATSGSYPFGDTKMRRKMAWIYEPYNDARFKGKIANMNASDMKAIMESVAARITEHVMNEGGEIPLEGNYKKIGGGQSWSLTEETGPASRMAMYNDGVKAFVAFVGKKIDGSNVYSIGRKSVWVPFDIPEIYSVLNSHEGNNITESNRWNGGDTQGGSPRETGSRLSPQNIENIINDYLIKKIS